MILLTGATGFIGGHLAELLAARGLRFRSLVRRRHCRVPGEIAYVDFASGTGIEEALCGVEIVLHVAGATRALDAAGYYTGNVQTTETLARALAGSGVRFVYVSSLAAVGPSPDGRAMSEDAEPRPLTQYAKSKLKAECMVRSLLPDAVIVRPPVVYGPGDTGVLQVLRPISKGWAFEIAGGERWFSAIYVKDLAEGLLMAALAPGAAGQTYFLAHADPVSWSDFRLTAERIMGRRARVVRLPLAAALLLGAAAEWRSRITGEPTVLSREKILEAQCRYWICDTRRAARELGFHARTSLLPGLSETLAWYKGAGWIRY